MTRATMPPVRFGSLLWLLTFAILLQALPAAGDVREADKESWQQRYLELLTAVDDATSRLEVGRGTYSKAKQRGRLQGDRKRELLESISQAEADLASASEALENFPEEARRAGVPPGWLREVEERAGIER